MAVKPFNLILCSFVFFLFCFCCFQVSPPATRSAQALGSLQQDLGMTNSKADLGERKRDGPIERSHTANSTENPEQSPQIKTLPLSTTLAAGARGWARVLLGPQNWLKGSGVAVRQEGEEGHGGAQAPLGRAISSEMHQNTCCLN